MSDNKSDTIRWKEDNVYSKQSFTSNTWSVYSERQDSENPKVLYDGQYNSLFKKCATSFEP